MRGGDGKRASRSPDKPLDVVELLELASVIDLDVDRLIATLQKKLLARAVRR